MSDARAAVGVDTDLRARLEALPADRRAALEATLAARRARAERIVARDRTGPAPLAPPQRRLWFLHQLAPGSPVYNAVVAIAVDGALDAAALGAALEAVIARHEILHTIIGGTAEEPVQVVLADWTVVVETADVTADGPERAGEPTTAQERAIALVRDFCRRPYDLSADLPVRLLIVRTGPERHLLAFAEHHIAFDAWSDEVLFAELSAAYRAILESRPWQPAPLAIQYADVACWWAGREPPAAVEDYWSAQLQGAPPALDLPTDRPRPPRPGYRGEHVPFAIEDVGPALAALRSAERATSFMIVSAAFASSVMRWSGVTDLVMGTPFANRARAELEALIGFFSNTLPLRLTLQRGTTFRELVAQNRAVCIGAFQNQELPFDRIVELARAPRDPSRNPLFGVNVRVQQGAPATPDLPGAVCTPVAVDLGFSRFDLAADFSVLGEGIEGYVEYDEGLFEPGTIAAFIGWMREHVRACLQDPDAPLLDLPFGPPRSAVRGRRRSAI